MKFQANELMEILLIVKCMLVIVDSLSTDLQERNLSRKKRFLLFPEGTNVIQIVLGIGVPVEVAPESIVFGWAFEGAYTMPSNLSELVPMDYRSTSRSKRTVFRWNIYKMLEKESEMHGYGGRPCILRSICEASDTPLDKYNGLFEELFHSVFTPTSTNEAVDHHTDNEYYAAQKLGRKNKGKCKQLFPDCKLTLLEMFTYSPSEHEFM